MRQQVVENIRPRAAGELTVYVARWESREWEQDRKPPKVMWIDGNNYRYLEPQTARRFAAALVQAADIIEAG